MTVEQQETQRWRGQMEARMTDAERRLESLNGSIEKGANATISLRVEVAKISTKVAVVSAAAAIAGSAGGTAAIYLLTKGKA